MEPTPPPATLRRLAKSNEGATIIEFGVIATVLLTVIFGVVEFGIMMFLSSVLEGATSMASRLGKTGYSDSTSRVELIKQEFYTRTGGLFDKSKLHICGSSYNEFKDVPEVTPCLADNDVDPAIQAGSGKQVTLYTVTYEWHILTPILWPVADDKGKTYINAIATVKNEGF